MVNQSAILTRDTAGYISNGHRGIQIFRELLPRIYGIASGPSLEGQRFGAQRSLFYGLPVAFFYQIGGYRLIVFLQGCWSSLVLAKFLQTAGLSGLGQVLIASVVCLLTPFVIFNLVPIPDFAAAPMVLGLALCMSGSRSLSRKDQIFWLANIAVAVLFHNSLVLVGLIMIIGWQACLLMRKRRRYVGLVLPVILGSAIIAVGYPTVIEHMSGMSDATPPFLLGRMIGDGNATKVLNEDCPRAHWYLCRYRTIPSLSSDDFLFSGDLKHESPVPGFNKLDLEDQRKVKIEAPEVIVRTMHDHGPEELKSMANTIGRQIFNLDLDLLSQNDSQLRPLWQSSPIDAHLSFHSYIYNHETILLQLSKLYTIVYLLCLPVLLFVLVILYIRGPHQLDWMQRNLIFLWAAVVTNAAVCAGLSGDFGRFQARVAWPIVASSLVVLLRLASRHHALSRNKIAPVSR